MGQAEPVGAGAGGQDQGLGFDHLAFHREAIGPLAQVDRIGVSLDQAGAPAHGLGPHPVHQVGAQDPVGEAGEILHIGGGHQLAAGDAARLEARDQQGAEVGPGGIDGGGVASGPRADDDQVFRGDLGSSGRDHGLRRTHFALTLGCLGWAPRLGILGKGPMPNSGAGRLNNSAILAPMRCKSEKML